MNIYSESPIVLGSPSFLYNNSMTFGKIGCIREAKANLQNKF